MVVFLPITVVNALLCARVASINIPFLGIDNGNADRTDIIRYPILVVILLVVVKKVVESDGHGGGHCADLDFDDI